jgi:phage replication O-like protein O
MYEPPNYTQIPNRLLDEQIPFLKEGELRVLLVIMRQTFGWHKEYDRLSLSQLSHKTGMQKKSVCRSIEGLLDRGLIDKIKEGENGREKCYYALALHGHKLDPEIDDDSNNSYQCPKDTPPSVLKTPTKETPTKEKKKNIKKKAPAAPPITLNPATKKFEGITTEDLKLWQETFPAVNVRKELERALLWALTTPRINYRKSINTWMRNVDREHTTPFKTQNQANQEVSTEETEANVHLAKDWEVAYEKKRVMHYDILAKESGIEFCMPNGRGYMVSCKMKTEEFIKRCRPALERMKLASKPSDASA